MRLGSRESSEKSINYNNLRKKYMMTLARLKWRGGSGIQHTGEVELVRIGELFY